MSILPWKEDIWLTLRDYKESIRFMETLPKEFKECLEKEKKRYNYWLTMYKQ